LDAAIRVRARRAGSRCRAAHDPSLCGTPLGPHSQRRRSVRIGERTAARLWALGGAQARTTHRSRPPPRGSRRDRDGARCLLRGEHRLVGAVRRRGNPGPVDDARPTDLARCARRSRRAGPSHRLSGRRRVPRAHRGPDRHHPPHRDRGLPLSPCDVGRGRAGRHCAARRRATATADGGPAMKLSPSSPASADLTYCTNIHPGERWDEVRRNVETYATAVRAKIAPDRPFSLGLRLSAAAAETLAGGDERWQFRAWLDTAGMYVRTINGFPFGTFHGTAVKENVYRPDWSESARVDYTLRLADLLSDLLPEGASGNISTVPGSFRPRATPSAAAAMVRHLAL